MFLKKGLFRFKAIGVAVGVVGLLLSAVVDGGSASGWSCGSSWPTVEAECATLAGAIVVEANAGASGGAELGGWDYSGVATVVLNAPFAGVYDVQVRTHAPYGAATRTLSVNGSVRSFAIGSASRGVVTVGSVSLVAGANSLVFSKAATDNNVANLDAVTAVAQTPPSTTVATTVPGATTVPLIGCGGSVWPLVEAECGLLSGAIVVEVNAGASGGKELGGWDYSGTVAVGLSAPAAGMYDLQVVMFAPYGAATRSLSVNGVSRVVSVLSATRGTVTVSAVPLVAGSNTLVFSRAVSDNNVVNLDKISAVLSGGTPPPTTIGGVTSTVPIVQLPTGLATPGTCSVGDAGGQTIFGDGFAAGWTDGSWDTPASLDSSGVGGSVGLSASRDQWKAIALNSTAAGGGVNVVTFALKGTGNWRVQGFENGKSKGFGSVTATSSWQTFNCQFDAAIVAGPVWVSFANTDPTAQTVTVDNIKLSTAGVNPTLGRIVASTGLGTGYAATSATPNGVVSGATTFSGPGLNGADALHLDVVAAAPFTVKLQNETGTVSYVDTSFGAGTVKHWFPLYTALPAERIKLTITPTSGTVTLNSVDLKNNPFVNVTVGTTTTTSVTATVSALPEPGLAAFLEAIPADQANTCATCAKKVAVTGAGSYTISGLTAGAWRLVLYVNSQQEALGASNDFEIAPAVVVPVIPPTTTPPATTAPVTTVPQPTTTLPNPNFPGKLYQVYDLGTANIQAQCLAGPGKDFGDSGMDVPAAAWNEARFSVTAGNPNAGIEYGWYNSYAVYQTVGGVTGTVSAQASFFFGAGGFEHGTATNSYNDGFAKIPAGTRLRAWSVRVLQVCLPPRIENPPTLLATTKFDLWLSIPTWPSGAYLPNPGSVNIYVNPPVNGTPVDPTPKPFGTQTNYLRSAFTDTAVGDVCLQPGSGNVQVGGCTSGTAPLLNLTFVQYNADQFRITPLGSPQTCLQIGDRDHPVLGASALTAQWGPCDSPFSVRPGHNNVLDELFTFTHTGAGYYNIKPAQNYANWSDPCLSIYAAAGNNGTSGNVVNSGAPPVIQFSCSGAAWQQWAPVETRGYTNPTGCTANCPPAPTGAHTLQPGVATPFERKTDLACLTTSGGLAVPSASAECRFFDPELVATGWIFHDISNSSQCLAPATGTLTVGLSACGTTSIWDDRPIQSDGLTFPLVNVATGLCLGGTTIPTLEYCSLNSNQLWYDATMLDIKNMINTIGISTPKLRTDAEIADYQAVTNEYSSFASLQNAYNTGVIQQLPLLSPMQQVFAVIWTACKSVGVSTGCIGFVWGLFNTLHKAVQRDLVRRTDGGMECTLGKLTGGAPVGSFDFERKLRVDNVGKPGCGAPTVIAEVKTAWPATVAVGQLQLISYQAVWLRNGVSTRLAGPADANLGWPTTGGPITIGVPGVPSLGNALSYSYVGSGVFQYWVQDYRLLVPLFVLAASHLGVKVLRDLDMPGFEGLILTSSVVAALTGKTPEQQVDILVNGGFEVFSAMIALTQRGVDFLSGPYRCSCHPVPRPAQVSFFTYLFN
jgi:Carbohydrate binding module (family 35)